MKFRFLIISLLFVSCKEYSNTSKTVTYFDLEKFVKDLEPKLKDLHVEKTWSFNNTTETKTTDDIKWDKELKIFADADINKASFAKSYDSLKTDSSTLYILKKGEKLNVKRLEITYNLNGEVKRISGENSRENYFFSTINQFYLKTKGKYLDSYKLLSVQKLLWFEADSSTITGKVLR